MDNQPLLQLWNNHTDELLSMLGAINQESFNTPSAGGGWSAGDIAEHLWKIDVMVGRTLASIDTHVDRDPGETIAKFTTRLRDRNNKLEAPEAIVPSKEPKNKEEIIQKIRVARKAIADAIQSKDMSLVNNNVSHRFYGVMTGFEWVMFVITHTERHMIQVSELKLQDN